VSAGANAYALSSAVEAVVVAAASALVVFAVVVWAELDAGVWGSGGKTTVAKGMGRSRVCVR
jgi:hypothetical protein